MIGDTLSNLNEGIQKIESFDYYFQVFNKNLRSVSRSKSLKNYINITIIDLLQGSTFLFT